MTPIDTVDEEIVADVPTDVANAVKRAIAALERITGEHPVIAPILQPSEFEDPHAVQAPAQVAPFGGFAPPSLDMSAEAIYARATTAMEADAATAVVFGTCSVSQTSEDTTVEPESPDVAAAAGHVAQAGGDANGVFVDEATPEDSDGDSNERSSALRRLIGGLRRKDR
jgi:hypothetical protein